MSFSGLLADFSVAVPALTVKLEAKEGITALVGPSGAGKTTALLAIAGLKSPSRGVISLAGQTWFDAAARVDVKPEARPVGLVFQSVALFPHLNAEENVAFGIRGDKARARRWLERLGVGGLAARAATALSGGEAQRVALARALAREPKLLMLDEPFSALDAPTRATLREELARLVAELKLPTLLVTHDRHDVESLAERVIEVTAGRVVQ